MATIKHRPTSPRPPRFRKGAKVAFQTLDGRILTGTFVRAFSPARNAGLHYEITTDERFNSDRQAIIMANGVVGRTVTVQKT